MTLYSAERGLAPGLNAAINHAMETIANPAHGIVQQLLTGDRKVLTASWCGQLTAEVLDDLEQFDPGRGDGAVQVLRPHDTGYQIPPSVHPGSLNWRMGVPFWVIGHAPGGARAIAGGLYHPLYCSALMDFWCPISGEYVDRLYLCDPRDATRVGNKGLQNRLALEECDALRRGGADLNVSGWPHAPALKL